MVSAKSSTICAFFHEWGSPLQWTAKRSPPMRSHLTILSRLLKEKGLRQEDVAKALGYKSASAIGMMLRGERRMEREVLEKICELAGVTIVELAAISDDLHIARRPEAVESAAIIDEMTPEEVAAVMPLLRAYRRRNKDR